MEQENKENLDEIGLYDLWQIIAKRKKLIVGLFLVCVISTAIISLVMPKIYRGEVVLAVEPAANIPAKDIVDFVGNIDAEKKAKLMPHTYSLIDDIRLNAFRDSKDKISVMIDAKDSKDIQPALSEIIEYINTINLVKMNVKEEQEKLLKRSAELTTVIAASSELLDTYRKLLAGGKLTPVGFNPVELNKRISDIKLEKLGVEQAIQRIKGGIEIANQLYIMDKPVKPKKKMIVVLSGITSLFISIFLAFFLEYLEYLEKIKKKQCMDIDKDGIRT